MSEDQQAIGGTRPEALLRASLAVPPSAAAVAGAQTFAATFWQRLDQALIWLGDRLNPILVKETRQALKSRQFIITFTLVLALAWIWSIFGVAMIGPSIYFAAHGLEMFLGYYTILAVPLLVVVPFGAFRSLASEREDGTYELLSITTLKPRQIVNGKLGSAVLQMLVYLSAIAPCLAFTYMLRGVDAPTILFVICWFFLASLGAAAIGLLVATLSHEKHWQIVLSVVFLFGLAILLWCGLMMGFVVLASSTPPFQEQSFWIVNAMLLTAYFGYFALCYCAASAQLTFASDNRATVLRMVMVAQQALLMGWFGWGLSQDDNPEMIAVYFILAAVHWSVMGIFINAESGELSLRVKRQLPQSFLGRAFLTWFNPGPATGYMFVVANLLAALLVGAGFLFYNATFATATFRMSRAMIFAFGLLAFSYVVLYLGLGRLMIAVLRRFTQLSATAAVLIQVLIVLAASGIPLSIHMMTPELRDDYSLIEISNPFYSLAEVIDSNFFSFAVTSLLTVIPLAAAVVFLLNLPAIIWAVNQVRIAKPERVVEEDAELEALRAAPLGPSSPFDDPSL